MPCKYFAPNGQPSILFNDLYSHYSNFATKEKAEEMAVAAWLFTRGNEFTKRFGDWQLQIEVGQEEAFNKTLEDVIPRMPNVYQGALRWDTENTLRELGEQFKLGNQDKIKELLGPVLTKRAMDLANSPESNAPRSVDENGEPYLHTHVTESGVASIYFTMNGDTISIPDNAPEGKQRITAWFPGNAEESHEKIHRMQNTGLTIEGIRQKGGMTYVTGLADADNLYFNDDVLNSQDAVPVSEFVMEKDSASRILKKIINDPYIDDNQRIATQIALGSKRQPGIRLMSRQDINAEFPSAADKKIVNMFYDASTHQIIVNNDININRAEFENVILEELIHANTAYIINSTDGYAKDWETRYQAAKTAMADAKMTSKHLENSTEFLYGVLRDNAFRNQLRKVSVPGTANRTLLDDVLGWIINLFGFRRSQFNAVDDMLDMANAVLSKGLVPLEASMMADIIATEEEENPEERALEDEEEKARQSKSGVEVEVEDVEEEYDGSKLYKKYLDGIQEKLLSLRRSAQQKVTKTTKSIINKEADLYRKQFKELQDNLGIGMLVRIGRIQVNLMANHLEGTTSLSEINENIKLLNGWRDFSAMIQSHAKKEGMELDDEVKSHVRDISEEATLLYDEYMDKQIEILKEGFKQQHVPPEIINGISRDMMIKDIGYLAENYITLTYGQNAIEHVTDFLIRRQANRANEEWIDLDKTATDLFKKVGNDLSFMFEKGADGKSRLITRYNKKLYEEMAELRSKIFDFNQDRRPLTNKLAELKKEFKKAKINLDNDLADDLAAQMVEVEEQIAEHKKKTKSLDDYHEFMRQNFDYNTEMTDEMLEEWEKLKEDLHDSFADIVEGDQKFNQYGYNAEVAKYNPYKFIEWVKTGENRPELAARFFKATPKKQFLNNPYFNSLTADQKEVYDFVTSQFVKAQENIPQDDLSFGEYEEDKILREFAFFDSEGLSKMKYLVDELKDFAQDLYTVKYTESDESFKLKGALTGRLTNSLRFKRIGHMINKTAGYFKKGDPVKPEIQERIDKGFYEYNKDGYLVKKSNQKLIENKKQGEINPITVFKDFIKLSINYKYKREVEDYINTARELAYNAEVLQTTADGRQITKFGSAASAKGQNRVAERLSATIDAVIYGEKKDPYGAAAGNPGERKVSLEKAVETLNNFTRARQLGLNFASGITNFAMGTIGNFQYAARGEFYTEKDLKKAYWLLKSTVADLGTGGLHKSDDAVKIAMFIKRFNLFGSFQEELFMNDDGFKKYFEKLFIFQKGGEYMNQGAVMVAMMLNNKAKNADGTPMLVNGEPVNMWDAYEVKDGRLVLKYPESNWSDSENVNIFGNAMLQVNKEIHGDYDPLGFQKAKKSLGGRILMMFRTWMPMAIKARVGKYDEDYLLSMYKGKKVYHEGRWRSYSHAMKGKGFKGAATNSLRFMAGVMLSTVSNSLGRKFVEAMDLTEEDKMNMFVNLKEAWWLMAISTTGTILQTMAKGKDDDDDEVTVDADGKVKTKKKKSTISDFMSDPADDMSKGVLNYLANQSQRVDNDLWFYYSPMSAYKVIRDPVAIGSTLKQMVKLTQAASNYVMNPEKDTYTRGFRKGNSKVATQIRQTLPVIRNIETAFSMYSQLYSDQVVN